MTDPSGISVEDMNKIIQGDQIQIPGELPILDFNNFVLFPYMIAPMTIHGKEHIELVSNVVLKDRLVGVFMRRKTESSETSLHPIGCAGLILRMLKIPDGSIRILLHGLQRISIREIVQEKPHILAQISPVVENLPTPGDINVEALIKQTQNLLQRAIALSNLPEELGVASLNMEDPGKLADLVTANLSLEISDQQTILTLTDTKERLNRVMTLLAREVEVLELGDRIRSEVKSEVEKSHKEYFLRQQLKAIHKELGEGGEERDDALELESRLNEKKLPEAVQKASLKEIKRLRMMSHNSPDYTITRTYIDWILDLPWLESTEDNLDIKKARKILDEDHYDLDKIKERILEYLSVVKLRKTIKGPILCFVGPPGVGKTSLGKSIARALDRRFYHFSLGGMRDEAEIRGHRRTYIGALPGRIISGLKNCGSNNPVIMLDEIDKLGSDFRGDPSSALLEVLDPEQNDSFTDHYLDLPFDLSRVMFITTANMLDTIPPALRDRMEVLRLSGYTLYEKIKIARKYLIPKEYEINGVGRDHLVFTRGAIQTIIQNYTREAGLRNLQREIGNICRKIARRVAEGDTRLARITARNVSGYLGPHRITSETSNRPPEPGVAVGLAWTQTGGEILFVESSATPGRGKLILTGQLGDVMKESVRAALTYLHSIAKKIAVPEKRFSESDLHIHIPAGSIPKDGPSAGITVCTSIASLLLGKTVKRDLAMTGEITIKGNVLPVGGIKEKVLAAHRSGIREIIMPAENKKDLEEIPGEVRKAISFRFTRKMSDVLKWAIPNSKN